MRGSERDGGTGRALIGTTEGAREADRPAEVEALAHAQVAELEAVSAHAEGRQGACRPESTAWTGSNCANWPTRCATSGRPAIVVLATAQDSNVAIISAVTKDLTAKVHAGKLVGCSCGRGRRQGRRPSGHGGSGGTEPDPRLPAALENVYTTVEGML